MVPPSVNLLLGLVAVFAVGTTLISFAALIWVTRPRRNLAAYTPPVTIYKPLKGIDEGLEENLRSFFQLDYPVFQLLFGVAETDDPAIDVVRRLFAEFPGATPSSWSAVRSSGSTRRSRTWRRWSGTASTRRS